MTKSNVFTAVFRDITTDEAGEITHHPKWSAGSWSHALDDRNEANAALAAANARIAELEAQIVKANDAWLALSSNAGGGKDSSDARDAARYWWLIDGPRRSFIWNSVLSEEEKDGHGYLEDAIDAAIAKEPK